MQRMFNLSKWSHLTEGASLDFINPRPRNVRIEVNAPAKSALYIVDSDGVEHFLALVEGRETIEFGSSGAFQLTLSGSDVMVYTADGDDISASVVAPVIFTKIANRRPRNPELEAVVAAMHYNMEKRLERQAIELERRFAASEGARTVVTPPPPVPQAADPEPAPASIGEPSDPPAQEAGGGSV